MHDVQLESPGRLVSPAPFVKWAGGKAQLLRQFERFYPKQFRVYYEPFLGGGAVFFDLFSRGRTTRAVLNDANRDLMNLWATIPLETQRLMDELSKLRRETESESLFKKNRSEYNSIELESDFLSRPNVRKAALLVYLNKTCYNGLYRVNSKGQFNVPFGRYKNPRILNTDVIRAASHVLKNTKAELRSIDYKDALAPCGKADFIYLDPPYQPPTKTSSFTDYTPGGFSEKDQKELAEEFGKLVDRGCTVVLSNSETSLTRHLYDDFEIMKVTVNRPINSVGAGRTGYKELIVLGRPR